MLGLQAFTETRSPGRRVATMLVTPEALHMLALAFDRALPLEVCGFLVGQRGPRGPQIMAIVIARGSTGEHGAFAIPDYEARRAKAWADDRGLLILALFHSHPSGDRQLSESDRAALHHCAWPWVIITRSSREPAISLAGYGPGDGRRFAVRLDSGQTAEKRGMRTPRRY
jgi:proteasome lid subunit RPN8/RPN11